jgi:DNA-binding XRE family transcriptional regulator/uncharacterized phage-associated protein
MKKELAQKIKKIREERGFLQEQMARELGISRPTYIQIENGERELNISEAEILASIFGMKICDLLADKENTPEIRVKFEKEEKAKKGVAIRVPKKNIEKFKEVLLYVLEKVGAKPNIGETAIYKLLYFIDFDFYEKYQKTLMGATYIKNHYGPTPVEFKKIVDDMEEEGEIVKLKEKYFKYEQRKYLPLRSPDLEKISGLEKEHIDEVLARLSDKNATELSDYSHSDIPWKIHKDGEKISYESVFYRDVEHSVGEYEDEL